MSRTNPEKDEHLPLSVSKPIGVRYREPLTDAFGRRIDHLRLSVTSACDLRCVYCRPNARSVHDHRRGDLTDGQRIDFIRYLHERHGLSQVRLTGGEPLLYPRLPQLIASIRKACPELTLAVTTNGRLLVRNAEALRNAGLDRLNVSLDSLDAARYQCITGGRLSDVLQGLDVACEAGFPPPKINTVVLRDLNDADVSSIAKWAIARGSEIRFLEAMPIGPAGAFNKQHFVSAADVRRRLSADFDLSPLPSPPGSTATRYRATAGMLNGIIATIAPVSEPFCSSCRRIRLTADGRLFPCLLGQFNVDIRSALDNGRWDAQALTERLGTAVRSKPERGSVQPVQMIQLGG